MRVASLSTGMLDIRTDKGNKQAVTFGDFDFLFSVGGTAGSALNVFFFAQEAPSRAKNTASALCCLTLASKLLIKPRNPEGTQKVKEQIKKK